VRPLLIVCDFDGTITRRDTLHVISDRCASLMADVVFARDGLSEHLAGIDVPFTPFEDFHDVRDALESWYGAAA
jgi:2-hydroxy-3-keto-5-methylthiopentenyl-1-phosphate phosphatase